ncbi:MAG: lytic transglycosylase [Desulfuromonas sp.]|nr:MAG: lytic transglycosylase [Desulfuromonas sp.]
MRFIAFLLLPILAGCLSGLSAVETRNAPEEPPEMLTFKPLLATGENVERLSLLDLSLGEPIPAYSMLSGEDNPWRVETRLLLNATDPETLADNSLLAVSGEDAPEDEGKTTLLVGVSDDFPVVHNAKVQYFIDYYTGRGHKVFTRWLERSSRYLPMMREIFAEHGLPKDLAYLAMVESGFNTRAYSWAHAVGPWQFIRGTGRMYDLKQDWYRDERRDFEKSTRAAARFLSDLRDQFDGEWYLAVASYNAGPGKIRTAIRKYKTRDFWEMSRGRYLRAETKNYVPKLMAALTLAKDPEKYGFTDLDFQEPLQYETVSIPSVTDLEIVARMSGTTYEEIKQLNPELKRWCTPPGETDYQLRIPLGSTATFSEQYAKLSPSDRANYMRYKIKKGDTLGALSRRYNVRLNDIIALNNIRNPRAISIGTNLVLPLKKGYSSRPVKELRDDYIKTRRQVYTVRSGDSLWSISRKFGVSEHQLRVWNRLGWSNVIRPGQRLVVSAKAAQRKVRKAVKADGPPRQIIYKVRSGDTLWGIGRKFAVETSQIRNWNNLNQNHVLQPGDKLTLIVRTRKSS